MQEERAGSGAMPPEMAETINAVISDAVVAERERCAKVVEGFGDFDRDGARDVDEDEVKAQIAAKIRSGE